MGHMGFDSLAEAFIPRSPFYDSPYGRLFPHLAPWSPEGAEGEAPLGSLRKRLEDKGVGQQDVEELIEGLQEQIEYLWDEGGRLKRLWELAQEMSEEHAGPGYVHDNDNLPAGYTYFGQFIDHDITFDPTSSLMRANDPNRIRNFRTPRLDLDCVYGAGPRANPHLYDRALQSGGRLAGFFLIGKGEFDKEEDLPRNDQGVAIIGDPRNDVHVIVSQVQLAFLKLHNKVLGNIVGDPNKGATPAQFREAQRVVRWFYQYVVWNDFVERLVASDIHQEVLQREKDEQGKDTGVYKLNNRFYGWRNAPYIPVEFSVAAYRFGHSLIRKNYKLNKGLRDTMGMEMVLPIFSTAEQGKDLRGGRKLPERHTVQWDWFLKVSTPPDGFPQQAHKIDTMLSSSVARIPPDSKHGKPLAYLNLLRGWRMQLPSGPDVARAMGLKPVDEVLGDKNKQALWYYILKEAETLPDPDNGGKKLGPVGGRIVAEVFAGLLKGDPLSYLNVNPGWTPDDATDKPLLFGSSDATPENEEEGWRFVDLIKAAGMPMDATAIRILFEP